MFLYFMIVDVNEMLVRFVVAYRIRNYASSNIIIPGCIWQLWRHLYREHEISNHQKYYTCNKLIDAFILPDETDWISLILPNFDNRNISSSEIHHKVPHKTKIQQGW